ncbi:MAG TPA: type II toxin-antitoxin system PemK/MazF family toxin [Chloroflexota bacterium]|nr:type II toxin-antitoxin system PemK/MazF family toxin [Chloroflexota bacterium]
MLLTTGEGNIPQRSVVNVSQVATVNKTDLTDESFIGMLAQQRMDQISSSLHLFL